MGRTFPIGLSHGKDFSQWKFFFQRAVTMGFSRSRTNGAPKKTRNPASFDCLFLPHPSLRGRKRTSFFFHTPKNEKKKRACQYADFRFFRFLLCTLKSKKTLSKNEKQPFKWVFLREKAKWVFFLFFPLKRPLGP